jgi:transketolase
MPNLAVIRPCDANETTEAWRWTMAQRRGPVAIVLTRQKLPVLDRTGLGAASGLARGAYVLADADGGRPQAIIIATGSEVHVALAARAHLAKDNVRARVVSMPCWEIFAQQSAEYQDAVLPPSITARVSVEAGVTFGWCRWVGDKGIAIGVDRFGASAPGPVNMAKLGLTSERVAEAVRGLVRG